MNHTATARIPKTLEPGEAPGPEQVPFEPSKLSDRCLLAEFLSLSIPYAEAEKVAIQWLQESGGFRSLCQSMENGSLPAQLEQSKSEQAWIRMFQIFGEIFTRQLTESLKRGTPLTSPADTLDYLQRCLQGRRREVFHCMFLDTRHRVICHEELFQGSIDGACVYPRVVAEHALRNNAAAVIVAHNHPSGVSEPSLADQAITRRLKDSLALLEIRLLDHFVIGDGKPVSMASRGML
jgi:DNA repair protein RadC